MKKIECTNGCVINSIVGGDHAYCDCHCHVGTLPAIPPSRERRVDPNNMPTPTDFTCDKPYCESCNPPVITVEQFIALAQRLRDAGCPTTGRDAFLLWEWSNREEIRGDLAIAEMKKLGYKPLAGFPLQRLQRYAFTHNELADGWTKFANSQMDIL